jgi:hypothetical protein
MPSEKPRDAQRRRALHSARESPWRGDSLACRFEGLTVPCAGPFVGLRSAKDRFLRGAKADNGSSTRERQSRRDGIGARSTPGGDRRGVSLFWRSALAAAIAGEGVPADRRLSLRERASLLSCPHGFGSRRRLARSRPRLPVLSRSQRRRSAAPYTAAPPPDRTHFVGRSNVSHAKLTPMPWQRGPELEA